MEKNHNTKKESETMNIVIKKPKKNRKAKKIRAEAGNDTYREEYTRIFKKKEGKNEQ